MKIQLSDNFTYGKLFRFAIPSVIMMIFTSIYGVVDGLFVSNIVGKEPFAAINLIMPILMIIGAFGFMMGAGGTAIVAKTLGEKDRESANKYFSMIVYITAIVGILMATLGLVFMRPLSELLGARGNTLEYCVTYGRIVIAAMPFFMLQILFQSFFIAAEKPKLGLGVTVAAGVTNIILDALFVWMFEFGLAGAAVATSASQAVGGIAPIFYFSKKNTSLLKLTRTRFFGKILLKSITNGSSELMSNISSSIVTVLYNMQLMKFAEEDGVAAYGVIMYISFIFIAMFIGYSIGCAPIISYHYGAQNKNELKNILRKSTAITFGAGFLMLAFGFFFSSPLARIFVGYDSSLLEMTAKGLKIFSLSFLFSGFCIFASSFFTALNNGPVSAAISFLRTLVYQIVLVLLLPALFKLDGIWYSMLAAEILAFVTTLAFLFAKKKKYGYM
ncbi:MAG: MATE family efflux transporter [Ruminococcaceae bacterium]|nr:MATE family efflux transporter [Oscillospiraceae bacterium]